MGGSAAGGGGADGSGGGGYAGGSGGKVTPIQGAQSEQMKQLTQKILNKTPPKHLINWRKHTLERMPDMASRARQGISDADKRHLVFLRSHTKGDGQAWPRKPTRGSDVDRRRKKQAGRHAEGQA